MTETYLYICKENNAKTSDISLLSLTPLEKSLVYQAGQYVEVLLRSGECLLLSIANAPERSGRLEFHLRHDASHPLPQRFLSELESAPTVVVRGPFGESTLEQLVEPEETLLFLAGGTGFAPIKALLEIALLKKHTKLLLYWGIRKPEDAYEEPLLQQWKREHPQFEYTLVLSEPTSATSWSSPTGLVHHHVAKMHTDMKDLYLFASGPYEMIKAAQQLFKNNGLRSHRFVSDMVTKSN